MADHQLVIRNGTVVDGSGAPALDADVAVDGGRITAVGHVPGSGATELDADGLLVTPGWVDIHTHYDGQVTWDPLLSPSCWHGVTTAVMGNCGVGFAPVKPDRHEWLIALMEGVEDIPGTALSEGLTWGWESFPEYMETLDRKPHTIDFLAMVRGMTGGGSVVVRRTGGALQLDPSRTGPRGVQWRIPAAYAVPPLVCTLQEEFRC